MQQLLQKRKPSHSEFALEALQQLQLLVKKLKQRKNPGEQLLLQKTVEMLSSQEKLVLAMAEVPELPELWFQEMLQLIQQVQVVMNLLK